MRTVPKWLRVHCVFNLTPSFWIFSIQITLQAFLWHLKKKHVRVGVLWSLRVFCNWQHSVWWFQRGQIPRNVSSSLMQASKDWIARLRCILRTVTLKYLNVVPAVLEAWVRLLLWHTPWALGVCISETDIGATKENNICGMKHSKLDDHLLLHVTLHFTMAQLPMVWNRWNIQKQSIHG